MSPYPRRFFSPTSNPCARCVDLPLCPAGAPLLPYHPPHAQGTDQQRCTRAIRAMDSTHHCSGRETHAARLLIPLECSPARLLAFEPAHPCPVFLPRHCILLLKRCASSPNRLVAPSRVVALPRLLGFDLCASCHFVSPCLHALPRGAVHIDFLLSVIFLRTSCSPTLTLFAPEPYDRSSTAAACRSLTSGQCIWRVFLENISHRIPSVV